MSALDGVIDALRQATHAQEQQPRSAITPEIEAMFSRWSAKVAHWLNAHDYTIPPPLMDDELRKAIEHDAKYDPDLNQWFQTATRMQQMHEQAKNMAGIQGSGSKGSGSFLDGSMSKKVPDPLPKQAAPSEPEPASQGPDPLPMQATPSEPESKSPGRQAGGSRSEQTPKAHAPWGNGEVAATSSSTQGHRTQGSTTDPNKPEKLAKIIPGPGNPNFNTRA
jgi:hypothetical protein